MLFSRETIENAAMIGAIMASNPEYHKSGFLVQLSRIADDLGLEGRAANDAMQLYMSAWLNADWRGWGITDPCDPFTDVAAEAALRTGWLPDAGDF